MATTAMCATGGGAGEYTLPWAHNHTQAADSCAGVVRAVMLCEHAAIEEGHQSIFGQVRPCGSYFTRTSIRPTHNEVDEDEIAALSANAPAVPTKKADKKTKDKKTKGGKKGGKKEEAVSIAAAPAHGHLYVVDLAAEMTPEFCCAATIEKGAYMIRRAAAARWAARTATEATDVAPVVATCGLKASSIGLAAATPGPAAKAALVFKFDAVASTAELSAALDDQELDEKEKQRLVAAGSNPHCQVEVRVHFAPAQKSVTAPISGAKAQTKAHPHPHVHSPQHTKPPVAISGAETAAEAHTVGAAYVAGAAYANLVLEDAYMASHLEQSHSALRQDPALAASVLLLKAWAVHLGLIVRPAATPRGALWIPTEHDEDADAAGARGALLDPTATALVGCGGVSLAAAAATGGLSGFVLTQYLLSLRENGKALAIGAAEENVLRAAWGALAASCVAITGQQTTATVAKSRLPQAPSDLKLKEDKVEQQITPPTLTPAGNNMNVMHRARLLLGATNVAKPLAATCTAAAVKLPAAVSAWECLAAAAASALAHPNGIVGMLQEPGCATTFGPNRFDVVLHLDDVECPALVSKSDQKKVSEDGDDDEDTQLVSDDAAPVVLAAAATARLHRVATTALAGRAAAICCSAVPSKENDHTCRAVVLVRLLSEPTARRLLLAGPPVEHTAEAAAFDRFWKNAGGTSARQFADGAVCRCFALAADDSTESDPAGTIDASQASRVPLRLLSAAVRAHCGDDAGVIDTAAPVASVLFEPDAAGAVWRDQTPPAQVRLDAAAARVRELIAGPAGQALPCRISSLDFVTGASRGTAPFSPVPHVSLLMDAASTDDDDAAPKSGKAQDVSAFAGVPQAALGATAASIEPLHAVLLIDDKRKIPDSLDAINAAKGALVAQLAQSLNAMGGPLGVDEAETLAAAAADMKKKKKKAKQNLEQEDMAGNEDNLARRRMSPILAYCSAASSVDVVVMAHGAVVRLHIAHYREASLLRTLGRAHEAAAMERRLFVSPRHDQFIRAAIRRHPSLAVAARLLQRWGAASPLLSDYVLPEAWELFACAAYSASDPNSNAAKDIQAAGDVSALVPGRTTPRTPVAGFLAALEIIGSLHPESTIHGPAPNAGGDDHDGHAMEARVSLVDAGLIVLPGADLNAARSHITGLLADSSADGPGLWIAAPYVVEPGTSPFTAATPRLPIAQRLAQAARKCAAVARAAIGACEEAGHLGLEHAAAAAGAVEDAVLDAAIAAAWRPVFTPSWKAFDAVIAMQPRVATHPWRVLSVPESPAVTVDGEEPSSAASPVAPVMSKSITANSSMAQPRRVWRLASVNLSDAAERDAATARVAAVVERDPAQAAVRAVRGAARDEGLVFYDSFAPAAVGVVVLQERKAKEAANVVACGSEAEWASAADNGIVASTTVGMARTLRAALRAAPRALKAPPKPLAKLADLAKRQEEERARAAALAEKLEMKASAKRERDERNGAAGAAVGKKTKLESDDDDDESLDDDDVNAMFAEEAENDDEGEMQGEFDGDSEDFEDKEADFDSDEMAALEAEFGDEDFSDDDDEEVPPPPPAPEGKKSGKAQKAAAPAAEKKKVAAPAAPAAKAEKKGGKQGAKAAKAPEAKKAVAPKKEDKKPKKAAEPKKETAVPKTSGKKMKKGKK